MSADKHSSHCVTVALLSGSQNRQKDKSDCPRSGDRLFQSQSPAGVKVINVSVVDRRSVCGQSKLKENGQKLLTITHKYTPGLCCMLLCGFG